MVTELERFMSKIDKIKDNGCWIWMKTTNRKNGYGVFRTRNGLILTHRYSWEIHHGEIPNKSKVLHKCDNPQCCNPDHLFLGSQMDNMMDMKSKQRSPHTHNNGKANGMSKLNETIIRDIRENNSESNGKMAINYSVNESLIRQIKKRHIWKHV